MQLNRGCSRRLLKLVLCGAILAPRKSLAGGPIERLCKIGHSERIWLDEAGLAQINSVTSSLCAAPVLPCWWAPLAKSKTSASRQPDLRSDIHIIICLPLSGNYSVSISNWMSRPEVAIRKIAHAMLL